MLANPKEEGERNGANVEAYCRQMQPKSLLALLALLVRLASAALICASDEHIICAHVGLGCCSTTERGEADGADICGRTQGRACQAAPFTPLFVSFWGPIYSDHDGCSPICGPYCRLRLRFGRSGLGRADVKISSLAQAPFHV